MRQYPDWSLYRQAQRVYQATLDTPRNQLTIREVTRHRSNAGRRAMWLCFGLALGLVAALDVAFTVFVR